MEKYLLLVIFISLQGHAAVYKWTDENGVVHFGDNPSEQVIATEFKTPVNNNISISDKSDEKWQRDYAEQKKDDAEQHVIKQKQENKRSAICNTYRSNLQLLQQVSRVITTSPEGNKIYLDDDTRTQKIKILSKNIKKNCK